MSQEGGGGPDGHLQARARRLVQNCGDLAKRSFSKVSESLRKPGQGQGGGGVPEGEGRLRVQARRLFQQVNIVAQKSFSKRYLIWTNTITSGEIALSRAQL
jgi:hypothetical protein